MIMTVWKGGCRMCHFFQYLELFLLQYEVQNNSHLFNSHHFNDKIMNCCLESSACFYKPIFQSIHSKGKRQIYDVYLCSVNHFK